MIKKLMLEECFEIISTLQDDKINFELSSPSQSEAVPFLGRSGSNNGVVDYVSPKQGKVNDGGVITVALDGSTGATFYQHHPFASGQNIWILRPKQQIGDHLDPIVAMYLATTIRKAVSQFSYNLSLTKTRLSKVKVNLPVTKNGLLDQNAIKKRMCKIRNIDYIKMIPNSRK